jgi:hypothetical protein
MLTGRKYEQIRARTPSYTSWYGLSNRRATDLLNVMSRSKRWTHMRMKRRPWKDYGLSGWPRTAMMACIRPPDEDERWHFVVTENGMIYDPQYPGPRILTRYGGRCFDLVGVIVPASAVPELSSIKNRF